MRNGRHAATGLGSSKIECLELKKIYFVSRDDYNSRIAKNYSFCKDESVGFLHFIKSKYKLNKKVEIVNYKIYPNPERVFFNLNNENIYKDKLILLNYEKQEEIKFLKLNNGLFVGNANPPYRFNIEKAIFSTNNNNINKISLEIINRAGDKTEILLSKVMRKTRVGQVVIALHTYA